MSQQRPRMAKYIFFFSFFIKRKSALKCFAKKFKKVQMSRVEDEFHDMNDCTNNKIIQFIFCKCFQICSFI